MKTLARVVALLVCSIASAPASAGDPPAVSAPVFSARLEEVDGTETAPPASAARWRQALHEARRFAGLEGLLPDVSAVRARAALRARAGVVPIGLLDLVLPARPGAGSARVFAGAALAEHTYRGGEVRFVLDEERYLTNGAPPAGLEIDPGDGLGYRELRLGEPAIGRYATEGRKTIRLHAVEGDGTELHASFPFDVRALVAPLPDDTLLITATEPYLGLYGTGEAYVYLSDAHATLTNPVVVIEGFDLDNTMNWDELYALLDRQNLIETLRAEGFDAVVLNFTDATDYMQKNAYVVAALIEEVDAAIGPGRSIALIGASLGGVVARYALAWMENHALDHRVRTFLSFDAPQRGANIPLGIQYWLDFFSDLSTDAAYLLDRLDTPAARQLLVYHHTTPPAPTGTADSLRGAFETDLAAAGDWPSAPRKVAIANGSGTGAGQGFAAGDPIIDYEYDGPLVDIRGNVWAVPDGVSGTIFDGMIRVWPFPATTMLVSVSGTEPYDNAPGGWRSSMAEMDSTTAPYGDIIALHPSHCFIPTISALALDTNDLFYPVLGDPNALAITPFDTIYCPAGNQEHVDITPENADWFLREIIEPATAVAGAEEEAPVRVVLGRNRPNPFNPATTILFELPAAAEASLRVYDSAGRWVATLVDGPAAVGAHEAVFRADGLPSGVYFYRLRAGAFDRTEKMTLLR